MRYAIACLFGDEVERYHRSLVADVAKTFGLHKTITEAVPAHFTLKYWFETDRIGEVDELAERFCKSHERSAVRVGGFGGFLPEVVFLDVALSADATSAFSELILELRRLRWMTWDRYDAENMSFHATLAEGCGGRYSEVMDHLRGKERSFDCWFDNITIVNEVSRADGLLRWRVFSSHEMDA